MRSSRSVPSSDASRIQSGILTPTSATSLNHDSNRDITSSRKRKRDSGALEELLKPTIVLKPHPPKLLTKPVVLQPLMIIPRGHFPLSYLDLLSPTGDLTPSRFYESHVRILDLENRRGAGPHLLIARLDTNGSLFAIEGFEKSLYTACKLGSWVELSQLSSKATLACEQLLALAQSQREAPSPAMALTTPSLHKAHKEKRMAIEALQSVVRRKSRTQSVSTLPSLADDVNPAPTTSTDAGQDAGQANPCDLTDTQTSAPSQEAPPTSQPPQLPPPQPCALPPPPSGEELLEKIRTQYFDALYRSKGSLAYFPKGPLSRARAAFHLESDISLSMGDLVEFLRGLVIPLRQMNKKYQETIPTLIKEMKTRVDSSGDERPKKRKSRKMKLGRNGLYPGEDENIRAWWMSNKPELTEGEESASESHIKSYIALLRSRETQLQLILILEILALEPLVATANAADTQLPGVLQPSIETEGPKKKKSKEQSLPDLADMHADLLCIWQSTASDEMRLLQDAQLPDQIRDGQRIQKASSEPLRDFCVDIIMPFFSARLPDLCDSLNRKLGGPVLRASPPKTTKPAKPKTVASKQPKPGAVAKRPLLARDGKSLQRAFSNDKLQRDRRSMSRGPSKAVAALLSATETAIPGLKRENSDSLSLMSIPRMRSDCGLLKSATAGSLSSSNSISGDDPRVKKKAMVEAELQDAIAALRKPNRQLAGASMVEAAEKRVSGSLSQIRKSRKPVRHTPSEQVKIKATPLHNRYRDPMAGQSQPAPIAWPLSRAAAHEPPPSSNGSVIPATAPRKGFRDALQTSAPPEFDFVTSTPARRSAVDRIDATPARTSAIAIAATPVRSSVKSATIAADEPLPADEQIMLPSSPLMARKAPPSQHLAVPRGGGASRPADLSGVRNLRDLFRTPVKPKQTAAAAAEERMAETPVVAEKTKKVSVYEKLGWDNEFDDL